VRFQKDKVQHAVAFVRVLINFSREKKLIGISIKLTLKLETKKIVL
jgi:hypothetical protein